MTTTTAFETLADAAVSARTGRDLFAFGMADRIPDSSLAKNSDGSITIAGVDLLKSGTFNGLSLVDADLEAMAQRFAELRDAGIFVPPFRLDHSWSILSVVGYFENVETYRRVDSTDSLEKTFLRGDIRLTGSVDYTPAQIVDAIKRGALSTRSSELGYYVTNSGVELPLVFYGAAFVDIPAVEGLAPVALSKVRLSTPHKITTLSTPEGSDDMTTTPDETTPDETPEVQSTDEIDAAGENLDETPDEETPDEDVEDVDDEVEAPDDEVEDEDPDEEETPDEDETPDETPNELEQLRRENARLRQEAADREIARFRSAGVIVQANEDAATALLSHNDEDVRRMAGTLLANLPSPVQLGRRHGKTTLSSTGNGSGEGGQLIKLGMSKDEVGPLWASLSTEERKTHLDDYKAWSRDRRENGVTD